MRLDGGDLLDLLLDAREQLSVAGHYFPNYSFGLPPLPQGQLGATVAAIVVRCPRVDASSPSLRSFRRSPLPSSPLRSSLPETDREARRRLCHAASRRPPLSFALGFRIRPRGARSCTRPGALRQVGGSRRRGRSSLAMTRSRRRSGLRSLPGRMGASTGSSSSRSSIPQSAVVQFHLGLARFWAGSGDPLTAWRAVADGRSGLPVRDPRGKPPVLEPPARVARIRPVVLRATGGGAPARRRAARRAASSRRERRRPGVAPLRRRPPARRAARLGRAAFERAAKLAPDDAEALVAAAVGAFDKEHPELAFGQLGPLTQDVPAGADRAIPSRRPLALDWSGRHGYSPAQARLADRARVTARSRGSPLSGDHQARTIVSMCEERDGASGSPRRRDPSHP